MDPNYDEKLFDFDYTTKISNDMQVPDRLSLVISNRNNSEIFEPYMDNPKWIVVSGSNRPNDSYGVQSDNEFGSISRPSLEAPPSSLVLGDFEYPKSALLNDPNSNPEFSVNNNAMLVEERLSGDRRPPQKSLSLDVLVDRLDEQVSLLMQRVSILEGRVQNLKSQRLIVLIFGACLFLKIGRLLM